jgi:hypothetical protein
MVSQRPARVLQKAARAILAFCAFLLGSCIDYQEEMWLNSDLSGRLAITLSVQEELVKGNTGFERDISEDGIRRDIERIPGVRLESFRSFRDAGKVVEKLVIVFDSVEKLSRYETHITEAGAVSLLGTFRIQESRGKMVFERSVPVIPIAQGSTAGKDFLLQGLSSLFLGKYNLNYKLHIPSGIITANTQRVDAQGQVVEWNFTLAQAVREPPHMQVEWKKEGPMRTVVFVGVLIAFAVIVFYYFRRRRRPLT